MTHMLTRDYPDDDEELIAEFIRMRQLIITKDARIRQLEEALADCVRRGGIRLRDVLPVVSDPASDGTLVLPRGFDATGSAAIMGPPGRDAQTSEELR